MKLNKLTLGDQKLFKRYLDFLPQELSAYAFANIFIWQSLYTIEWTLIEDSLCIFFRDALGCFMYLPPLSKGKLSVAAVREAFMVMDKINKNKDISRIENVGNEQIDDYLALDYRSQDKYPDYLCLRSDIAALKGNKFKSQRAAYNYFIKHNDYAWRRLTLADREDCLNLFNAWVKERKSQCRDDLYCGMLDDNCKVIKKALANYKALNLEGLVVRVGKEIKAFTFGYRLNKHTFCVLYEITDLTIKGLAQFIFRQFSQDLKDYKYINIMDDSGLENLRKTKLAYKPARLVNAYIVLR